VYSEVKRNARAALLRQIERERDGDMIDRSLLKNILDIFIEVGWGCGCWACAGGSEKEGLIFVASLLVGPNGRA
jgi:hypothetical protein